MLVRNDDFGIHSDGLNNTFASIDGQFDLGTRLKGVGTSVRCAIAIPKAFSAGALLPPLIQLSRFVLLSGRVHSAGRF